MQKKGKTQAKLSISVSKIKNLVDINYIEIFNPNRKRLNMSWLSPESKGGLKGLGDLIFVLAVKP